MKKYAVNQQVDLKNCAVLLTKTGLACLNTFEDGKPLNDEDMTAFYCSNDGIFRRYMSRDEFNSLCGLLPQVHVAVISDMICELPDKWQFLWSWKISDFTSHKPETCFNGGDYAFYMTHNIFGRINAGKLELLRVVKHTTSADFEYDEYTGGFEQNCSVVDFLDCDNFNLCTKWFPQDGEYVYSLQQFGEPVSLQDALNGYSVDIYEDRRENGNYPDPPKRIQILKDVLGWEPTKRR